MKRMRVWIAIALFIVGAVVGGLFILGRKQVFLSPLKSIGVQTYVRTLDQYSFSRLRSTNYEPSQITKEKTLKDDPDFTSYLFSFTTFGKKVTGMLNIPKGKGPFPVLVLVRGYVEKEEYTTGVGTRRASESFAKQGYITISPDFLGYGGSDPESFDIFETRFEKPRTVLHLLASLPTIPQADTTRIGIWGHSNGGQIAISVLEISQKVYPTVLWAPVTLGFPESVLAFVDELPDKGEYIKGQLDIFHQRYKDEDYSISNHVDSIRAPIQLHQGLADEYVQPEWSKSFIERVDLLNIPTEYFEYAGENHNFTKGSYDTVISRDVQFFSRHIKGDQSASSSTKQQPN